MRLLLFAAVIGAYATQATEIAHPHDAGYWAGFLSNLATVATVLYAMFRWGKSQKKERDARRAEHDAEMVAKQKLFNEIVIVHHQLAPPHGPNIIERMDKAEGRLDGQDKVLDDQTKRLIRIEGYVKPDGQRVQT